MIKTFITSFKLRNAYMVNSFIYSLKGLPLINKLLPDSLYEDKTLKVFGNIIFILKELVNIFVWKLLYVFFMIFTMSSIHENNWPNAFIHIFTFLTICGGIINTHMFETSKDRYYAIMMMNMDAKKYTLSNFYYSLIKVIIGLTPFIIIFGLIAELPLLICVIMPVFVVMIKLLASNIRICKYIKTKKIENGVLEWAIALILLAMGYGLPFIGVTINETNFVILFIFSILCGIYSLIKMRNFDGYRQIYKKILTTDNIYTNKKNNTADIKKNIENQIEYDGDFISNKKGFAYFHDLFVKRHKKILTEAVKKQSLIIFAVFAILIFVSIFFPEAVEGLNSVPLTYLPYFVFVMYSLNRGTTLTQAMFMNCDHSMLTYKFYRAPKVILGMFKERLKTLITVNLLPALVIAIGLPILLLVTGGTDNILNYVVLFVSIISMSIFFSVHYLVMYYVLQPYNINTELKSATYTTVQGITYMVCYYMLQIKLPTIAFGIATIVFSIAYSIVALILAYILAPKTFKIRI